MQEDIVEYIHLPAGSTLPLTSSHPRRTMVLIEEAVDQDWRDRVSEWIIASGCLYMMAWGEDCSLWDDSVDYAMLQKYGFGDIPDNEFVMTTWHSQDSLAEVFFFARACASHPTIELPYLTIIDVRNESREAAIRALHHVEAQGLLDDVLADPRDLPLRERLKILFKVS